MGRLVFAGAVFCITCSSATELEMPLTRFVTSASAHHHESAAVASQQRVPALVQTGAELGVAAVKVNASAVGGVGAKAEVKAKVAPKTWFAITVSTALVVKTLCMLSNVIFQVSPFPSVKDFYANADTGSADAAPYMSILYGGSQWCFYGTYAFVVTGKSGFLVLVYSNVLGAILGVYYTYGFWANCRDEAAVSSLYKYMSFAGCLVFAQMVVMCTTPCQNSLFFSGLVSSLCSVLVSLSILSTLPLVLKTRCSSSINVRIAAIGAVSAVLWLICGMMLKDKWICVPNSIGLCILMFTLSLSVYFPRDPFLAEEAAAFAVQAQCEACYDDDCHAKGKAADAAKDGGVRGPNAATGATASTAAVAIRNALVAASTVPTPPRSPLQRSPFAGIIGKCQPYGGDTGGTGGTV